MGYQEDFITTIAPYVTSWRNFTGYGVASAIIAQACIESAYGKSNKAQHNNYFGLKYKSGRVSCNSGVFYDTSYEWVNGQYVPTMSASPCAESNRTSWTGAMSSPRTRLSG